MLKMQCSIPGLLSGSNWRREAMKLQQCSGDDAQRLGEQHCTGGTRSGGEKRKNGVILSTGNRCHHFFAGDIYQSAM